MRLGPFSPWVQQNELLNLTQLLQKLLGGDSVPGALRELMQMLQKREAKHAIKSMDANAIGPVTHRPPAQPVSIFKWAKNPLDFLLAAIADGNLLGGGPIHAIGEQHGATQAVIHEPLPGSDIKIKLQPPLTLMGFNLITDPTPPKIVPIANAGSCYESGFPSSGLAVYSIP
jgi:hypothetical protein